MDNLTSGYVYNLLEAYLVTMDQINLFPNPDASKHRKESEKSRKSTLIIDNHGWNVINLESIGQVANALSIAIGMGHDDHLVQRENHIWFTKDAEYLVSPFNETLR